LRIGAQELALTAEQVQQQTRPATQEQGAEARRARGTVSRELMECAALGGGGLLVLGRRGDDPPLLLRMGPISSC
jgi:hypothetical protein